MLRTHLRQQTAWICPFWRHIDVSRSLSTIFGSVLPVQIGRVRETARVLQRTLARPPAIAVAAALGDLVPRQPLGAEFMGAGIALAGRDDVRLGGQAARPKLWRAPRSDEDDTCDATVAGENVSEVEIRKRHLANCSLNESDI